MVCNIINTVTSDVIEVKAGDVLTTEWHHGLEGRVPSDGDDPIAASHKGPILGYLAKVDDATQTNIAGLECMPSCRDSTIALLTIARVQDL